MCGICAVVSSRESPSISHNLKRRLCNRGPDHLGNHEARVDGADGAVAYLSFTSTVLSLRGDHVAKQPFVSPDSADCVFCWNGEAWKIHHHDVAGNDGEAIFGLLMKAASCASGDGCEDAILKVLRSIEGPFAFVFCHISAKRLYFGRDRLGRRSLLIKKDSEQLLLSSIADSTDSAWKEVEADGIYAISLDSLGDNEASHVATLSRYDWIESAEGNLVSVRSHFMGLLASLEEVIRAYSSSSLVLAVSIRTYLQEVFPSPLRHLRLDHCVNAFVSPSGYVF